MSLPTLLSQPRVPQDRLRELGFADYASYLASEHWQLTRSRLRREKPERWQCEACGSTAGLNVHHRTYRRFGRERLGDLIVLCGDHHRALHEAFWAAGTQWSLWNFGREWIDRERRRHDLSPLHPR